MQIVGFPMRWLKFKLPSLVRTQPNVLDIQFIIFFSVDFDDGSIRMNKQTPSGIHDFKAKVHDYVMHPWANVTCTVRVVVEEITDEAIYSSGSVRLSGKR